MVVAMMAAQYKPSADRLGTRWGSKATEEGVKGLRKAL